MRRALGPRRRRFLAAPVFVEVFSGKGSLAAELRALGFAVIEWDIEWGPSWDLTNESTARLVRGWAIFWRRLGLRFGVPCETWTRARDRGPLKGLHGGPGWPSRLRSDEHLWGLPELICTKDLAAVAQANRLVRVCRSFWFWS